MGSADHFIRDWVTEQTRTLSHVGAQATRIEPDVFRVLLRLSVNSLGDLPTSVLAEDTDLDAERLSNALSYLRIHGAINISSREGDNEDEPRQYFVGATGRADKLLRDLKMKLFKATHQSTRNSSGSMVERPLGLPFGFTESDWRTVVERRADYRQLRVVMGLKYQSDKYDTRLLVKNIRNVFAKAVEAYNDKSQGRTVSLRFSKLTGGLGEHVFRSIARGILSADISVFEVSDRNPNVMLELGVALTWDVRPIPILAKGCERTPSDIAGLHWLEYQDSGRVLCDPDARKKIRQVVRRALRLKVSGAGQG